MQKYLYESTWCYYSRGRHISNLLVAGLSPRDLRGKNRSGNAISGDICIKINDHVSK